MPCHILADYALSHSAFWRVHHRCCRFCPILCRYIQQRKVRPVVCVGLGRNSTYSLRDKKQDSSKTRFNIIHIHPFINKSSALFYSICSPVFSFFLVLQHTEIGSIPAFGYIVVFHSFSYCTSRLMSMGTVVKAAIF